MSFWIAGCDKPHRCTCCWRVREKNYAYAYKGFKDRMWRVRKYLPWKCSYCDCWTLTTNPWRWWGRKVGTK